MKVLYAVLVGLGMGAVMSWLYGQGRVDGFVEGSAAGFAAGLRSKPVPPKIFIIKPPCVDGGTEADLEDSVLWRI